MEGASGSRVARAHGINANQVLRRRLYVAGGLAGGQGGHEVAAGSGEREFAGASAGAWVADGESTAGYDSHRTGRQAQVRIEGSADPALVRVLLECSGR